MSSGIFVISDANELVEMAIQPYETEDVLQKLLADYPGVLAGEGGDRSQFTAQAASLHRKDASMGCIRSRRVVEEFGGRAEKLWNDEPTAREVQQRFDAFDGIGQKKAAMAVELLARDLRVPIRQMEGSDIAFDVHVRRVFLRTCLAERDDQAHMIDVARKLHPDRPGELDFPAWLIGRQWCIAGKPNCIECVLREASRNRWHARLSSSVVRQ